MSAQKQTESIDGSNTEADGRRPSAGWTVRGLLAWITPFLQEKGVDSPRVIAEILLGEVLGVERLRLYMEPDREVESAERARLRELVARAGRHEPVQFLVGRWPFLGRDFEVEPCTLIPRPCTEVLVERALEWFRTRSSREMRVLDLCTGTGCIGITLALGMRAIARPQGTGCAPIKGEPALSEPTRVLDRAPRDRGGDIAPRAHEDAMNALSSPAEDAARSSLAPHAFALRVIATDIDSRAIDLARRNAKRLGADVECCAGDLYDALVPEMAQSRFDLIVANPPYVTDAEYAELDRTVRDYEPARALRGGDDGLECIRRVVEGAAGRLSSGGMLLVEIGWKHADAARALVDTAEWCAVTILADGEGHPRILEAHRV